MITYLWVKQEVRLFPHIKQNRICNIADTQNNTVKSRPNTKNNLTILHFFSIKKKLIFFLNLISMFDILCPFPGLCFPVQSELGRHLRTLSRYDDITSFF